MRLVALTRPTTSRHKSSSRAARAGASPAACGGPAVASSAAGTLDSGECESVDAPARSIAVGSPPAPGPPVVRLRPSVAAGSPPAPGSPAVRLRPSVAADAGKGCGAADRAPPGGAPHPEPASGTRGTAAPGGP